MPLYAHFAKDFFTQENTRKDLTQYLYEVFCLREVGEAGAVIKTA